jgi:hypothetical protein
MSVSDDIVKLSGPPMKPQFADVTTSQGKVPEDSFQLASNLRPWEKFDVKEGIFRPLNMVENLFQCLRIKGGKQMKAVLASLVKVDPFKLRNGLPDPRNAWQALNHYPVAASDSIIKLLEERWTGKQRKAPESPLPDYSNFAAIYYEVRFTNDWRLSRVLTCLVLNKKALAELRTQTDYKRKLPPDQNKVVNVESFGEEDVIELVEDLQKTPIIDDIVAATEKRTQIVAKTDESGNQFILIETGSSPDSSRRGQNFVSGVFRAHSGTLFEQKVPYLRASIKVVHISVKPLPATVATGKPESELAVPPTEHSVRQALLDDEFILMVDQERREKANSPLCIFRTGHVQEPPDLLHQLDIIASIIKTGNIYFVRYLEPPCTDDPYNYRRDTSRAFVNTQVAQNPSNTLQKERDLVKHALEWYRHLLHKYKVERGEVLPGSPLPLTDPFHGLPFES